MLAATSDLDVGKVIDAISGGAAGSWQLSNLGPRIIKAILNRVLWCICSRKILKLVCKLQMTSS